MTTQSTTQAESGRSFSEQIRRASAPLALVHQIEIPEDAVQRKRDRQAEPLRAELLPPFPG